MSKNRVIGTPRSASASRRWKQQKIIALFGTIEYQKGYDYKRERRSKRS